MFLIPRLYLMLTGILFASYTVSAACPSICNCNNYGFYKEIRCASSGLTSIPSNLPADTQVLRLELNNIESISETDLVYLVNLKQLTIYNNIISFIHPNAFQNQVNLEVLNLKYNRIPSLDSQVFRNTEKLADLNLDNNLLISLENGTFNGLLKLNDLDLDGNPLESLPNGIFSTLSNLRNLDISNVAFESISSALFSGLTKLASLKLNNVTQNGDGLFDSKSIFSSIPNLHTVEIKDNHLSCIPTSVTGLYSLRVLTLSRNPLTCNNYTGLKQLRSLEELHMDDSELTTLTTNMFEFNTNLTYLLIEYSSLSTVEPGAFNGLGKIKDMVLALNNLSTLPNNVFSPLPSTVIMDLSGNPWHCDCHLRWLHMWLATSSGRSVAGDCATPDRLQNQAITNIDENDFACSPEYGGNETVTHSVVEGKNFVMDCGITGDPSPARRWLTPDHTELLPNTNEIPYSVDAECTLTIIRIRKEDEGTYSCTGTNAAGSLSIRNIVNVVESSNMPSLTTATYLQPTSNRVNSTSEPLKGGNNSMLVITAAAVGFLVVLIALIMLTALIRKRNKRKNRLPPGLDSVAFRNANSTLPGLPCSLPLDIPFADSTDRYADTLQREPSCSAFDPPPPYSTIPESSSEGIYQEIQNEDNLYEKPRNPGDASPACATVQHTYMAQMMRQDSCVSNASCGTPAGYERSMIHGNGKLRSDTMSTCNSSHSSDLAARNAQANLYIAVNNQMGNIPRTIEQEQRVRLPDLDLEPKVTYQNTRRT